jgi:hypothetical protein
MLRRLQNPGFGVIAATGSGYACGRAYADVRCVSTECPKSFPAPNERNGLKQDRNYRARVTSAFHARSHVFAAFSVSAWIEINK